MSDLREAINAAFEQSDAAPDVPPSSPPTEPVASPVEGGSSPEPTAPTTAEPLTEEQQRARDALGRFTKADQPDGKGQVPPAAPKTPLEVAKGPRLTLATQPGTQNTPKFEPPPKAVPPALRSHWTGLTPEWRAHITETHAKMAEVEQQYAPIVDFAQRFARTIEPYRQAIQVETGGDPIAAVRGLMDTATKLRFGTPNEKAATVAQIVKAYGVDIATLDSALVGALPTEPQGGVPRDAINRAVQEALSPLVQRAQQHRQQQDQALESEVRTELQAFAADPKHEFFGDVRDLMADAIEVADRQGYKLSLEDAYARACLLHPEVSKVMIARQAGQSAQSLTQAAQRAKAAAVSVKGSAPVGNPEPTAPSSVRDAIEAAIEVHSRV